MVATQIVRVHIEHIATYSCTKFYDFVVNVWCANLALFVFLHLVGSEAER